MFLLAVSTDQRNKNPEILATNLHSGRMSDSICIFTKEDISAIFE